jgi:hypothetical protein
LQTPTAEQIRTLAPDAAAARAGQALADPRRWTATGRADSAAWGLCQGSGAAPYQTAVDLGGPAYRCSCPSHKIPCKHALGLLFLLAAGSVEAGDAPEWVREWLTGRAARAEAAATRGERSAPVDEASRAKRIESRERKIAAGIDELDRWLVDLIRRGLDEAHGEGHRFWDAMAARLVDAQAPGLGRSVRWLGAAASGGTRWPHALLEGAGRLHLISEAYRRLDELPEPLRADVRSLVGWTIKEEELASADAVEDRWAVVGRTVDDNGQVITARTFLLGEASRRWALHLAFGVYDAPPTALGLPPAAFRATLVFYPSATPLRAAVRPVIVPHGEVRLAPPAVSIDEALDAHAARLAVNPFVGRWPVALADVSPVIRSGRLLVRDAAGRSMGVEPWSVAARMLAVSSGHPVTVVGEFDGRVIRPLSIWEEDRLVPLEASDVGYEDGSSTEGSGDEVAVDPPGWPELVSAALLGTERTGGTAPVPAGIRVPAAGGTERTILAAAAAVAVRRRAATPSSADGGPVPAAAAIDPRPALGGAAARIIGEVATGRRSLLAEAIDAVEASGRRLPDEWLPAVLLAVAGRPTLLEAVDRLSGARVEWLAGVGLPGLDDVAAVARTVAAGRAAAHPPAEWDAAWAATGAAPERAALARSIRRADPAKARESIAKWLPEVAGDERADILAALEEGLEPADEAFVTSVLGDRRLDVKRAAADLLVRIDGSRFGAVIEDRARPLLASQGVVRQKVSVVLPEIDDELEEAGFGGKPPQGVGERAWLLRQIVAHVRPRRWSEWLSADASAIVDRALRVEEARPILDGLIEAAGRFEDADWIVALLANPKVAGQSQADPVRALARLPVGSRLAVATRAARFVEAKTLARVVAACPGPWPLELTNVVLATSSRLAATEVPDQGFYDLVRSAATWAPADRADRITEIATHGERIRPSLEGAIETLQFRVEMRAAFAALPPLPIEEPQ